MNQRSIDINPALTVEQASYTLISNIEQSTGQTIILGGNIGPRKLSDPKAELLIYPVNDQYYLAYHISLEYLNPSYNQWDGFINAHTGAILNKYTRIAYAAVVGTGQGFYKDTKSINITQESDGSYDLLDKTKAMYQNTNNHETGVIVTYDFQKPFAGPIFNNYSTFFNDGQAVDAHYNAGIDYDYYYNQLHRNDNQGMSVVSVVNAGPIDNAFWDGYEMIYGDGSTIFSCLSYALDVVAHELTHGVTQYTAGLNQKFAIV